MSGERGVARLELTLLREDGAKPYTRRFEQRIDRR